MLYIADAEDFEKTLEEEEDDYLAQAAFEHMRLNDDQVWVYK